MTAMDSEMLKLAERCWKCGGQGWVQRGRAAYFVKSTCPVCRGSQRAKAGQQQ
jgi:DnaJ-class molecular chaperone